MTVGEQVAALVAALGWKLNIDRSSDGFAVVSAPPEGRTLLEELAQRATAAGLTVRRKSKRTLEIQ